MVRLRERARLLFLTLICGINLQVGSSAAETYEFDPRRPLALGIGVDPAAPLDDKRQVLTNLHTTPSPHEYSDGGVVFVRDVQSLESALQFDASASVRSLTWKGQAEFHRLAQECLNAHTITLALSQATGTTLVSLTTVDADNYVQTLKAYVKSGDCRRIRESFGTEFVQSEVIGHRVTVLVSIRTLITSNLAEMSASAGVSFRSGLTNAEARAEFSKALKTSTSRDDISINVTTTGGDAQARELQATLASVITSPPQDSLLAMLQNQIKGFIRKAEPKPIRFVTVPIGICEAEPVEDAKLEALAYQASELVELREKLRQIQSGGPLAFLVKSDAESRKARDRAITQCTQYLEQVGRAHSERLVGKTGKCAVTDEDIGDIRATLPVIPTPYVWRQWAHGGIIEKESESREHYADKRYDGEPSDLFVENGMVTSWRMVFQSVEGEDAPAFGELHPTKFGQAKLPVDWATQVNAYQTWKQKKPKGLVALVYFDFVDVFGRRMRCDVQPVYYGEGSR